MIPSIKNQLIFKCHWIGSLLIIINITVLLPILSLYTNDSGCLFAQPDQQSLAGAINQPIIKITRDNFSINGFTITRDSKYNDLQQALGIPSRTVISGGQNRHIWDDYGIGAIINEEADEIIRIVLFINNLWWPFTFAPNEKFSGQLIVEQSDISKKGNYTEIMTMLSTIGQYPNEADYLHSYILGDRKMIIFVSVPDDSVVSISFE